jgi:hypothetical protein
MATDFPEFSIVHDVTVTGAPDTEPMATFCDLRHTTKDRDAAQLAASQLLKRNELPRSAEAGLRPSSGATNGRWLGAETEKPNRPRLSAPGTG